MSGIWVGVKSRRTSRAGHKLTAAASESGVLDDSMNTQNKIGAGLINQGRSVRPLFPRAYAFFEFVFEG